jgi:hypothetical protein
MGPRPKEHDLMTRSIVCGLLALTFVGVIGVAPLACQSGGVGDPCTPEDEYNAQFTGFNVAEENIEPLSFQCSTRICLVNHFQGRVSCPLGQPALAPMDFCKQNPDSTQDCGAPPASGGTQQPCSTCPDPSQACVLSQSYAPQCTCDPTVTDPTNPMVCAGNPGCAGVSGNCDPNLQICTCSNDLTIDGVSFFCEPIQPGCSGSTCSEVLNSYICHTPQTATASSCQSAANTPQENEGKQCCVPGTDQPVSVEVCGQCDSSSFRDAPDAVYCSCRCCAPCCAAGTQPSATNPCSTDTSTCGTACDPNFNYCSCPSGFTCTDIRPNVGLGDQELAGAYCIKAGSAFTTTSGCGNVVGNADPANCQGTPASAPTD